MSEPTNLVEAFRDRTEALDALGRAVVVKGERMEAFMATYNHVGGGNPHSAPAGMAFHEALDDLLLAQENYYEAHKTVQKFMNGDH